MNHSALWEFLLPASQPQLHLYLSARVDATAAEAAVAAGREQWLGSFSLSVTFCSNLTERQHTSASSAHAGRESSRSHPSSAAPGQSLVSFVNAEACTATWGYFSHLDVQRMGWTAEGEEGCCFLLLQNWDDQSLASTSPRTFSPSFSSHARVKSAGFLIHRNPPSNCVMILILFSTALDLKARQAKQRD